MVRIVPDGLSLDVGGTQGKQPKACNRKRVVGCSRFNCSNHCLSFEIQMKKYIYWLFFMPPETKVSYWISGGKTYLRGVKG